jgi:hypothetical protein
LLLPFLFLLTLRCTGLKETGPDGGETQPDASSLVAPGKTNGPGPFGALPSGYCCAQNSECRSRNCISVRGMQVCADDCFGDDNCAGGLKSMTCVGASASEPGRCEIAAPALCIPSKAFELGTGKLGACCTPTGDVTSGSECLGGHCAATGTDTNPYVCSNICSTRRDCPGAYLCAQITALRSECVHEASVYTCAP